MTFTEPHIIDDGVAEAEASDHIDRNERRPRPRRQRPGRPAASRA